ncbi:MAG: DUF3343 domain-containing protein [Clostridia bacterium]|nr:DUF3343 domain-containing protein [Clostridia bacterium]MBQ9129984.1 DUF3343 domain-containing protein [Clostridia bacterium]
MKANDKGCVIAMSSMTYALRAEGLLKSRGMRVRIIKLPQGRTKKGCTYGLEMSCVLTGQALLYLNEAGIGYGELLR